MRVAAIGDSRLAKASEYLIEFAIRHSEAKVLYGESRVVIDEVDGQSRVDIDRRERSTPVLRPWNAKNPGKLSGRRELVASRNNDVVKLDSHPNPRGC